MRAPDTILPLEARGLGYKAGGVRILSDVSFSLARGAPTIILGPNGAGKSVLLRLLHGLLTPSEGEVTWAVSGVDAARRQAMVFQRPVLLRRSVRANVVYPMRLASVPSAQREARVMEALGLVGLEALANRAARSLSGGEQQRLTLARAAALAPDVLFLDEPCANLDPAATRSVEESLHALAMRGTKIVMTTHDLGQARRLAGDILFLHGGHVAEHSSAAVFFTAPATDLAGAFLRGELLPR